MPLKDEFEVVDTVDPGAQVQAAFDAAQKIPWTIARHSAAMLMGASILSGVFGPEIKELQERGTYSTALRDVVIATYLLSLTPAQVNRINARQNVDEAVAEAFIWAEKEGLTYGSAKYLSGVRTLTEIVGGIYTSFYGIQKNGNKEEPPQKNSTSPPGKSGRRFTPRKPAGTPQPT